MFFRCHLATTLLQNHHIYDPCTILLTLAQSCTQFPADESCIQSQEQIKCLHWLTCLWQNIQLLYPAYAILNLRQSATLKSFSCNQQIFSVSTHADSPLHRYTHSKLEEQAWVSKLHLRKKFASTTVKCEPWLRLSSQVDSVRTFLLYTPSKPLNQPFWAVDWLQLDHDLRKKPKSIQESDKHSIC
jgi:hypothetical protein